MSTVTVSSSEYLDTLRLYHEEEIMGEAYFRGLADHFDHTDEREKLMLLAQVERFAAESVRPLLTKYRLVPRPDMELNEIGESWIEKHRGYNWQTLMLDMVERYPDYMPYFEALEAAAPVEDRAAIRVMTHHEIATIVFAEKEIAREPDSLAPIFHYLETGDASWSRVE